MKPVEWIFSVVLFLILYQYKSLRPVLTGLGIVVILGMVLRSYDTIRSQFIGVVNMSGGGSAPKTVTSTVSGTQAPASNATNIYNKTTHKSYN